MNELEKCMAGELYDCHHEVFLDFKNKTRTLLTQYNQLQYNQKKRKQKFYSNYLDVSETMFLWVFRLSVIMVEILKLEVM